MPVSMKAKLRHVRVHDLRHTFASLLIQNGESLAYVKDQLGHSSIAITVDLYGHLVPGSNRAAVDRLDAAPNSIPGASGAEKAATKRAGK
jgi:integrase